MTNRELSEKLYDLATKLEDIESMSTSKLREAVAQVADELHELSLEKYTPGNKTWDDIKAPTKKKKQPYVNTAGKKLPF